MKHFLLILSLAVLLLPAKTFAKDGQQKRTPKYLYEYRDRDHTSSEIATHLSIMYGISWATYLFQWDTFREEGSFKRYGRNFGKFVFDKDQPVWNWMVHPLSGSQMFLFYRATGYSRIQSLAMTFISSTLFELTVEIYTEPASVQDLYQTPVIGSVFGVALETLSLYLLNSGHPVGKVFGHIINPCSLLWFYEGKVLLTPEFDGKDKVGLSLKASF